MHKFILGCLVTILAWGAYAGHPTHIEIEKTTPSIGVMGSFYC
jgi:hypothetical protein